MQTVSSLEMMNIHDIYTDIKANTVVFFISDFLNQILRNENKNLPLFTIIDELQIS